MPQDLRYLNLYMGKICFVVGPISMVHPPPPNSRLDKVGRVLLLGLFLVCVGYLTGIIANAQPVIFVPEANKTTQFIRLCNASNIPIIYLHNVTGFMVGAKTESQGLIKAGAQLVNAVSNSKVSIPPSQSNPTQLNVPSHFSQ